jgi:hypothetical protein
VGKESGEEMKEISYAVIVEEYGDFVAIFPTVARAECSSLLTEGRRIVEVTGILHEPKKLKLMAPCLYRSGAVVCVSGVLFGSEREARGEYLSFVSWPAIPDASGMYEVPT